MQKRIIKLIASVSEKDMTRYIERGSYKDPSDYVKKNIDMFRGNHATPTVEPGLEHVDSLLGIDVWYSSPNAYYYICTQGEGDTVGDLSAPLNHADVNVTQVLKTALFTLNNVPNQYKVGPNEESSYDVAALLSKALKQMTHERYYLLGENVTRTYHDEGIDSLISEIKENKTFDGSVQSWMPAEGADTLVEYLDGWMGYAEITKDDYDKINVQLEKLEKKS